MVNSPHRRSDNLEAAQLATDAESRVRGGESAREALLHESQTLRHLETHHSHLNSAHYRKEMFLVHNKLHKKLEHDGLLPKMHIPLEGHDRDPRRQHPFQEHKNKSIHRRLDTSSTRADLGDAPTPLVEKRPRSPESPHLAQPVPVASLRTPSDGDLTVTPPKRLAPSELPAPKPVAPRLDAQANPGTPGEIDNWGAIHDGLVKKANSTAPDLAFYGDSITDGMSLNNAFARGFGGRAENFGIHSDTTDNLRYRLENGEMNFKDGKQPKDVVMLIGTNDIGKKTTGQIAHDIIADAELAATKLPGSRVLLLGLLPRAGSMAEVQDINRQLAAYMSGPHAANLRYADVGSQMLNSGRMVYGPAKTTNESQLWQPGGLHPTYGPGYARLLHAIDGALRADRPSESA